MCLIVTSGPHVATVPILIYKVLKTIPGAKNTPLLGESPFMSLKYHAHDLVTSPITVFKANNTGGWLKVLTPEQLARPFRRGKDVWEIYKGLHGYLSYDDALQFCWDRNTKAFCIVPMVIPEGATYFLGHFGHIVTDTLITSI